MIYRTLSIALLACGAAFAQLESAIITGTTAPAAAKAGQTAVKGINTSLGRAGSALGAAAGTSTPGASAPARSAPARTGASARTAVPATNPNVADSKSDFKLDEVKVGMTRGELMALAGKPYSKITIPIDGGSSERLTYQMKDGGSLRIVLEHEKVTEIKPLDPAR